MLFIGYEFIPQFNRQELIIFSCACQRQSSHSVQFQCASTIVYHQSENISKVRLMLVTDVGDEF